MRSILALGLALLVLASEAPGVFIESPVCAAVDGRDAVARDASAPSPAKSCCGGSSCPMHAKGCGAGGECPMTSAPAKATPGVGSSDQKLCAPSCGSEGARVMPGVPDPGTLGQTRAPASSLAVTSAIQPASRDLPARNPVPAVPPPRA